MKYNILMNREKESRLIKAFYFKKTQEMEKHRKAGYSAQNEIYTN